MNIPPIIRMGIPSPDHMRHPKQGLVVLVLNRGWFIVKWSREGYLIDQDRYAIRLPIDPRDVVCWMPEDGS